MAIPSNPNAAYWKKRFQLIEQQANLTGADSLAYISEQYRKAAKEIEAQTAVWYARLAQNNGVTMHEAKQLLDGNALKEFHWTVQEYIQYGQENALNGAWMQQLENASAKWHITKLEALQLQNQAAIEALFGAQYQSLSGALGKVYQSSYYHSCYEVQKAFGIGWDIAAVDEDKLSAALSTPWTLDGSTFSDRLWANKQKLIQTTQSTLTQGIMTGKKPDKLIAELQAKMNSSKASAGRLVMTESAAVSAMGQKAAFGELGVEEFEVVETLDHITCEVCAAMDGQHFPMSEFEVGVTAPPFHPWCRGCTCPYFHDEFTADSERIARATDGTQYCVPGDTTYQEWKAAFVDGDSFDFMIRKQLQSSLKKAIIKSVNDCDDFEALAGYLADKYDMVVEDSVQLLNFESVKESVSGVEHIIIEFPQARSSFKRIGTDESGIMSAGYDGDICFNPDYYKDRQSVLAAHSPTKFHPPGNNPFGSGCHEAGHILEKALIDKTLGEGTPLANISWRDSTFAKAIVSDACKQAKKHPEGKGKRKSQLMEGISGYARKGGDSECLAEAVCDFAINGEKAAILSRIIWELLKKELG